MVTLLKNLIPILCKRSILYACKRVWYGENINHRITRKRGCSVVTGKLTKAQHALSSTPLPSFLSYLLQQQQLRNRQLLTAFTFTPSKLMFCWWYVFENSLTPKLFRDRSPWVPTWRAKIPLRVLHPRGFARFPRRQQHHSWDQVFKLKLTFFYIDNFEICGFYPYESLILFL